MLRILPETEGPLVAVQAGEFLTGEDYESTWVPSLKQAIARHGMVRALLYLDETFKGWDAEAMWADAKMGMENAGHFEKIAVIGEPRWLDTISELIAHLAAVDVRTFPTGGLAEALGWILEDGKRSGGSRKAGPHHFRVLG